LQSFFKKLEFFLSALNIHLKKIIFKISDFSKMSLSLDAKKFFQLFNHYMTGVYALKLPSTFEGVFWGSYF
jgi:hypothetical protein